MMFFPLISCFFFFFFLIYWFLKIVFESVASDLKVLTLEDGAKFEASTEAHLYTTERV